MKFQTQIGMHDILPEDEFYYQKVLEVCREIADFYGFERIETPILEETQLFEKGTGGSTDIVHKQMFSLRTLGGDHLTLRPEGTPGIVRAYIQHGMQSLPKPVKLWYFGPFFRYERPQAGRYRQFYQFGFESFGIGKSVIDAQIIQLFYDILKELGFKNLTIEINSIGDSCCRPYYKKSLVSYLRKYQNVLCKDCQRRLRENPLRVLDCKQEKCQRVVRGAPQIIDSLCQECHDHFQKLLEFLEALELPYHLNPYLVRGLDYYTRTVFEIYDNKKNEGSRVALVGGGRYDKLVQLLGGKNTPACGAAGGVERIIDLMKAKGEKLNGFSKPTVFLAQVGKLAKRKALSIFEKLRESNVKVAEAFYKDSLLSQLSQANRLGVRYVLILGQKEALENKIIIKDMKSGHQKTVSVKKMVQEIKKKLKK